jgi:hypothetical protein
LPREIKVIGNVADRAHDEFEQKLLAFCGPLYIAANVGAPPSDIIANGTFGLVDTGTRRIIVTCYHVWDFYEEERAKNPEAVMALVLGTGFKTYAVTPTLIDADRNIDLAVFEWDGPDPDEKEVLRWYRKSALDRIHPTLNQPSCHQQMHNEPDIPAELEPVLVHDCSVGQP